MAVIGTTSKPQAPKRLSIRITADGFSFITEDPATGALWRRDDFPVADPADFTATLRRALDHIAEAQYAAVEVVVSSPSTRIPLDEFRRDDLPTLYRVVFPATPLAGQDICYTILPQLEVAEIFTIAHEARLAVSERYPLCAFRNVAGHELERMLARHRREPRPALYIHTFDHTLLVASFADGEMTFANTFPTATTADALYFTLYTFQTLGLDPRKARIIVSGNEEEAAAITSEARKYVKEVVA